MNQPPTKLKSAVVDFAFPGLRQSRADARTQLQLENIESTFNDIWERFKRLERAARSNTRQADEISRQLTQNEYSYEQHSEAQKYCEAIWGLFQSSRKLRSRLNRLIFKARMLALQCQAEESSKVGAASSLLTDIRSIESGVSEVTKTLEVAHAKFLGLINQKVVQSQMMLADSQRRAGFLEASQESLLIVLLGPDSSAEERVLAARKIASLANLAEGANLALLVSGFLVDDFKSFRGKASDLTALLTAHTLFPADALKARLVDLVSLASNDKTVDTKLAVSGLMARALGDWVPELAQKLQLSWVSKAFQLNGLEGIRLSKTSGSTLLDQIEADLEEDAYISSAELVSVLVPVRNGEKWLGTAIRSLQGQTWQNIEVIVVDDASEDSTLELALQFAASDSRVKVIASNEHKGAYSARNIALDFAAGEFVTVHDADDWSHPRKIERQVRHLVQNPAIQANLTQSARVLDETLAFQAYLGREILRQNSSSLMCRRQVFRDLGYWDEVPFGADTEFHHRLVAAYGSDAAQVLNLGVLSLTRFHADSLSGGGPGSMALGINSSRATYMNRFNNWHLDNAGDALSLRLERGASNRPFDLPAEFLNIEHEGETCPLALVGDLSRDSQNTKDILDWLSSNPGFSKKIALRHTPEPKHPNSSLSTDFAEFTNQIVVLERSTLPNALKIVATAGSILNATPLDSFSTGRGWEVLVRENALSSEDLSKISSLLQVGEHEVRQVENICGLLDEVAKVSSKTLVKRRSRVSSHS
jgi:glycosyltransferase involved in cell wall biosynthesis